MAEGKIFVGRKAELEQFKEVLMAIPMPVLF